MQSGVSAGKSAAVYQCKTNPKIDLPIYRVCDMLRMRGPVFQRVCKSGDSSLGVPIFLLSPIPRTDEHCNSQNHPPMPGQNTPYLAEPRKMKRKKKWKREKLEEKSSTII